MSATPLEHVQSPAARAVNLTKSYGKDEAEVHALAGVSVDIRAGEFTAIMGPSGSGKSTLMHCMAGLDAPSSGRVEVSQINISDLKDKALTEMRRDRIGFVFQSFNLIPTLTAEENILLPLSIAGKQPDQAWYDRVIDAVGLASRLHHRPNEMSGGQQQRVACARALVSRPAIVFADEPTGNLDSTSGAEVLSFLRRSVDDFGQTIVMVTHDPIAASYTDRVVFLADGLVVDELREPTAESVLEHMTALQQRTLGSAVHVRESRTATQAGSVRQSSPRSRPAASSAPEPAGRYAREFDSAPVKHVRLGSPAPSPAQTDPVQTDPVQTDPVQADRVQPAVGQPDDLEPDDLELAASDSAGDRAGETAADTTETDTTETGTTETGEVDPREDRLRGLEGKRIRGH